MPDRPQPEFWGYPPFNDGEDLDAWLAGYTIVTSPAVDAALTALLAPPSRGELTGEPLVLAEFRRVNPQRPRPVRARPSRPARRPPRRTGPSLMWLGTAAALLVVAVFGAATVTGRIPNPIQDIGHVVFASHPSSDAPADRGHKGATPGPSISTTKASLLPTPDTSSAQPSHSAKTATPTPSSRPTSRKSPPSWLRTHGADPAADSPATPAASDAHDSAYRFGTADTFGTLDTFGAFGSADPAGRVGEADSWSASARGAWYGHPARDHHWGDHHGGDNRRHCEGHR
jgi:hypothetical protein